MQYQDMILEACEWARERTARFKVRVLSSPAGEMKPEEAVPIEYGYTDLQAKLQKLDKRGLDRSGLIDLGRTLALLLLPPGADGSPANIRGLFADSLRQVGQGGGLRLRLRLPPELAGVPWEFMYVERAGGGDGMDGFLALDPRVAIVRHEALPVPAPLPAVSGALRVVAALASPSGLPPLDLALEEANLKQALGGQPGIQLDLIQDATLAEVQARLPGAAVFHFAGHGAFATEMEAERDTVSGIGILALDDQYADAEQLGVNLRGSGVRLAVLGGCETGRRDATSLNSVWSSVAAALVKAEVPAVVANQYDIQDACAMAFSQQFYRTLADRLPIERAVSAGRIAAYNADQEDRDWGVPVLYLRAADGQLFARPKDETPERRNLVTLLDKVKRFWTEGVLDAAVRGATLIDLQKSAEPEAVEHPLAALAGVTLPPGPELPPDIPIAAAFAAMDQALLIIDGTGSGKTTALLALAQDAIARAEHDPSAPIPVVLNLASWSQAQPPIADWVAAELALRYQIPREMGRRWLDEGRLELLLDGLDEAGPEYIGACIAALNRFREDHGLLPICICTRAEDYRAAGARLRLSGAVELLPLTDDQIATYLAATGAQAATLAALLRQDAGLQEAARTPLMLSLMRQAFADLSPEDLEGERFIAPQERRERLLNRYVAQLAARADAEPNPPFTRDQTQGALSWLARGMTAQRQSIFLVEQLQPAWLATRGGYWAYWVGSRGLVGLLIGLVQAAAATTGGTPVGRAVHVITALLAGALIGIVDGAGARMAGTLARWPFGFLQVSSALIAGLLAGACFYLAFGPGLGLGADAWRLADGAALAYGLVFGLGGVRAGEAGDVRPVEALAWSWDGARRGLLPALLLTAIGMTVAIFGPADIPLKLGAFYSLLAGLALITIYAWSGRAVQRRSYPNQGTWLSVRNACRAGLLLGLGAWLVYGIGYSVLPGLVVGLRVGVLAALFYGLFDVIKHLVLRGLLVASGGPRWNLVPLLDHAARLGFLQKVGGGYMFPNRLVQEHFQRLR